MPWFSLAAANDLPLDKKVNLNVVKSFKSNQTTFAVSPIVPCANNLKEYVTELNKKRKKVKVRKGIRLIFHENIDPKKHIKKINQGFI